MSCPTLRRWLVLLAVASVTSGCVFTDVELQPLTPPTGAANVGRGREVVVQRFRDAREAQDRCGIKKNGYNSETANVLCPDPDMGNWLSWVFAGRLKAGGFVVQSPGAERGADPVYLSGELTQIFVEPVLHFWFQTTETDFGVHLVVRTQSGMTADRTFFVKGEDSSAWGGDDMFQISFQQASDSLLTKMTRAVAELMNHYPGMGTARGAAAPRAALEWSPARPLFAEVKR